MFQDVSWARLSDVHKSSRAGFSEINGPRSAACMMQSANHVAHERSTRLFPQGFAIVLWLGNCIFYGDGQEAIGLLPLMPIIELSRGAFR